MKLNRLAMEFNRLVMELYRHVMEMYRLKMEFYRLEMEIVQTCDGSVLTCDGIEQTCNGILRTRDGLGNNTALFALVSFKTMGSFTLSVNLPELCSPTAHSQGPGSSPCGPSALSSAGPSG